MSYPLSISQQEILRLANIAGEEINTLSFSVLFPYHGDSEVLIKAANAAWNQYPDLNTVVIHQQNVQLSSEDIQVVQPFRCFCSLTEYTDWAGSLSSAALQIDKQCAEIYPASIAGDNEGFYVRLHHAVADGWAAFILLRCLHDQYISFLSGKLADGAGVCPYQLFVEAELSYLSGRRGCRDAAFWRDFLSGKQDGHLLSEQTVGDFSCRRITESLDSIMVQRLESVCSSKNRTLQSVFFSAVAVACREMESASRFCLGTILLNRLNDQELSVMGNCFSTVPVPVTISDGESFTDLNNRISDSLFSVLRRQRTSYSLLTSQAFETPPVRPLFDILINYQDYSEFCDPGVSFIWHAPSRQIETLQIGIIKQKDTVRIHYDYRPDSITADKTQGFHARILAALEEILRADWDTPVDAFKQVPDYQAELLQEWNDTDYPYPDTETLYSLFEKQLSVRKDQIALRYGSDCLTYSEFETGVRKLAALLAELRVGPGQIVGILLERSFDMLTAIYAAIRCGAAYMPIGLDMPVERAAFMLQDSNAPVLLTHSWLSATVPDTVRRVDLDMLVYPDITDYPPVLTRPELPAYVIYTSGSTGEPKGVLISHRSIVNRIWWMHRIFGMDSRDVVLQKTPYTFDVSVWELFWWSNYGGELAILPPDAHKDPGLIIQAVGENHVTKMHFVPSMLSAFLAFAGAADCTEKLSSLRQVFASGEALMPSQVSRFYQLFPDAELINLYGPTECSVDVSFFRCPRCELNSIPIGKPVDNTKLFILDEKLAMLPIGAAGELCIGGNLVGMGYLNRAELTKERFINNPFGEGKLYRTGDLACWRRDGQIEYLGRMDNQVKLRGQRVELGEIEHRLSLIPGVRDAIAAVQRQDNGEAVLVAYYTGDLQDEERIRKTLFAQMPEYMIPQAFMHLDTLPLSANGKADRKRLPRIIMEGKAGISEEDMPETPLQKRICAAFAHALQCSDSAVGLGFHFFENGGTSLLAIMLLTELLEVYPLQLRDIYENPTPRMLSQFIAQGRKQETASEVDYSIEMQYRHIELLHQPNPGIIRGKGILITGTTGFLGVHLLRELVVRFPFADLFCLVRNVSKLEQHWSNMFPEEPFPGDRVICIAGDITKPGLGMSADDQRICAGRIAAVYHCAADVRHFGQWERSYAVNTVGTEHVISFCLEAGATLHHVSTMSVNGFILTPYWKKLSDTFSEDDLFVGQRFRDNVYVHSKYLAEKAILDARSQGLRANIYRVCNLLWRDKDGRFQQNREAHDFYMFTHAFLRLRAVSEEFCDLPFDLTAVDLCAEAIGVLSEGELGMVFHMMNPNLVTLTQYLGVLSDAAVRKLSMDQLEKELRAQSGDPACGFLLSYLMANQTNHPDTFPRQLCDQTVEALAQSGFTWKKPSSRYIRYVL